MSLGGGVFTSQNKVIPGTYMNFVSASGAAASLSDRGIVAMPLELNWGPDAVIFEVTNDKFENESLNVFGYAHDSNELKGLRDLFILAKTAYFYRLNSGVKASGTLGTAKYSGTRGNDLKILVSTSVEDESKFDVTTILGSLEIETQTVAAYANLIANEFVVFDKAATLVASANPIALTGGTNGTVTGTNYQDFINLIESYSFHTLGCLSTSSTIQALMIAFTRRMRDDQGVKFTLVLYNAAAPDYEGVINIKNAVVSTNANELVYWVTGASAGCAVNKSNTNKKYNGEYTVNVSFTQLQLIQAINAGYFTFHKVGDEVHVLEDINSLTTKTTEKGDSFKSNQVIRVLDQIGNDIAVLFNETYLGKVQNNAAGRISLWSAIVAYNKSLETLGAIENFTSDDVTVTIGEDKKSVTIANTIQPVYAMEKLYMTVYVN